MSASSKYKSGATAAALSSADQEKGAKRNVILWHQGFKECFQAAITFLLCVHDLSCWVQVLAWALAAIEGKWLCMRHLDQLPAGCCCSPHPPPDYQGYRLAQICSGYVRKRHLCNCNTDKNLPTILRDIPWPEVLRGMWQQDPGLRYQRDKQTQSCLSGCVALSDLANRWYRLSFWTLQRALSGNGFMQRFSKCFSALFWGCPLQM